MAGPYVNISEQIRNISNSAQAPLDFSSSGGRTPTGFNLGSFAGPFGAIVSFLLQQAVNDIATKRQNEYNAPAAQMARLTAAGINPYSAVNQIAGNNTSAPYKAADANILGSAMMVEQLQGQQLQNENMQIQNDAARLNLRYQRDAYFTKLNKMKADANRAYWTWQLSQGKVTAQEAINRIYGYKADYAAFMYEPQEIPFQYYNPQEGIMTDASFNGSPQFYLDYILPRTLGDFNIQNLNARTLGQKEITARNMIARIWEQQYGIPFNNNNNFVTALKFFVSPEGQRIFNQIVTWVKDVFK